MTNQPTAEHRRLAEDKARQRNWKRWGPYLSERQWGTVREDYSANSDSWADFPHEHARSRAYRWGEDGLMGFADRQCRLCFSVALWNGRDPILKERLFGLTGPEGNHGEDVKEFYYYLDSTPTHSYAKALYRYPHAEFPYRQLVEENRRRDKTSGEFELVHTGVFDDRRYFDVFTEYAKGGPNDLLVRTTINNRGPEPAEIYFLPTLWFRNTWIWGCKHEGCTVKPTLVATGNASLEADHESLGKFQARFGPHPDGRPFEVCYTENETNSELLFNTPQYTPYVKDAFHRYIINGQADAVIIGYRIDQISPMVDGVGVQLGFASELYHSIHVIGCFLGTWDRSKSPASMVAAISSESSCRTVRTHPRLSDRRGTPTAPPRCSCSRER